MSRVDELLARIPEALWKDAADDNDEKQARRAIAEAMLSDAAVAKALRAAREVIGWAYTGAPMQPAKVIVAGELVQQALAILGVP